LSNSRLDFPRSKLLRIDIRPSISVWKGPSAKIKNLIGKKNVYYGLNIVQSPVLFDDELDDFDVLLRQKLSSYSAKEKKRFFDIYDDEIRYGKYFDYDRLYDLILNDKKISGSVRGVIAETSTYFLLEKSISKTSLPLKLRANFIKRRDEICVGSDKIFVGTEKEFDYLISGGDKNDFKSLRFELERRGVEIILNNNYRPIILEQDLQLYNAFK